MIAEIVTQNVSYACLHKNQFFEWCGYIAEITLKSSNLTHGDSISLCLQVVFIWGCVRSTLSRTSRFRTDYTKLHYFIWSWGGWLTFWNHTYESQMKELRLGLWKWDSCTYRTGKLISLHSRLLQRKTFVSLLVWWLETLLMLSFEIESSHSLAVFYLKCVHSIQWFC